MNTQMWMRYFPFLRTSNVPLFTDNLPITCRQGTLEMLTSDPTPPRLKRIFMS